MILDVCILFKIKKKIPNPRENSGRANSVRYMVEGKIWSKPVVERQIVQG
jgi:hypothetical protein